MLTARELPALEPTDLWMDQPHQDVFYHNPLPFQNTKMIQKLEDHIKPPEILHTLIKFHYQLHIQDKILTISLKQLQPQLENQKKFQYLILQLQKLTQLSMDRKIKKVYHKKKEHQLKESLKKFQFLILQLLKPILLFTDKAVKIT
jgi:hypothetical protein